MVSPYRRRAFRHSSACRRARPGELLRPEKVGVWRWLSWSLFDEMMASNPWARRDRGHRAQNC